jgi:hypothetical protein
MYVCSDRATILLLAGTSCDLRLVPLHGRGLGRGYSCPMHRAYPLTRCCFGLLEVHICIFNCCSFLIHCRCILAFSLRKVIFLIASMYVFVQGTWNDKHASTIQEMFPDIQIDANWGKGASCCMQADTCLAQAIIFSTGAAGVSECGRDREERRKEREKGGREGGWRKGMHAWSNVCSM